MDKYTGVKKRLLPLFDRHEPVVIDSSGMQDFIKCNRLYFYKRVLAKAPSETPVYIYFGAAYHKFREVLSTKWVEHVASGGDHTNFPPILFGEAAKAALAVYDAGGPEPDPEDTKNKWRFQTKARLMLTMRYALQHWLAEKKQGAIKVLKTELASNFEYANGRRKSFRVDEIIEWNGALWLRDFKTSAKKPEWYATQLVYKDQAKTYIKGIQTLMGRPVKGIIFEQMWNDVDVGPKENRKLQGPEIHIHLVSYTPSQLEQWEIDQIKNHQDLDTCRENDIYPMVQDEYQCPHCPYKKVCTANNENGMYAELQAKFKTSVWNNAEIVDA